MADGRIARTENPMAHTTSGNSSAFNFIWTPFCASAVFMRSHIWNIFIITHNDRSVALIIPVLLSFLQLKYQGIDKTPFTTHSKTMSLAVFSAIMYYYLAFGAKLRLSLLGETQTFFTAFKLHCMVFFGNMAAASLASIFFSDTVRPFLYVMCILVSSSELFYWVYQREEDIFTRRIYRFFINLWRRWLAYKSMEPRNLLPR